MSKCLPWPDQCIQFVGVVPPISVAADVQKAQGSEEVVHDVKSACTDHIDNGCRFCGLQQRTIDRIASRGITIKALLEFLCFLLNPERAAAELEDMFLGFQRYGLSEYKELESGFNANDSTMRDVVKNVIIPLTAKSQNALSTVLMRGQRCYPKCMVTHTWANVFIHTLAAIVADALGVHCYFPIIPHLKTFDRVRSLISRLEDRGTIDATYWLCAASINQHTVMCDALASCSCGCPKNNDYTSPDCEIGKFDKMMGFLRGIHPDFYQVVAWDKEIFYDIQQGTVEKNRLVVDSRTMCIHQGRNGRFNPSGPNVMPGDVLVSVNGKEGPDALLEICKQDDKARLVIKREGSVITRIWVIAEIAQVQETKGMAQKIVTHFPLLLSGRRVLQRIASLDVRLGEASIESDREMILDTIADKDTYNAQLRKALYISPVMWADQLAVMIWAFGLTITLAFQLLMLFSNKKSYSRSQLVMVFVCSLLCSLAYGFVAYYLFCLSKYRFLLKELYIEAEDVTEQHMLRIEVRHLIADYLKRGRRPKWAAPFFESGALSRRTKKRTYVFFMAAFMISTGSLGIVLLEKRDDDAQALANVAVMLLIRIAACALVLWVHQEETGILTGREPCSCLLSLIGQVLGAVTMREFYPPEMHFLATFVVIFLVLHLLSLCLIASWRDCYQEVAACVSPSLAVRRVRSIVRARSSVSFKKLELARNTVLEGYAVPIGRQLTESSS